MLKLLCCICSCIDLCLVKKKKKISPIIYDYPIEDKNKYDIDNQEIEDILVEIMYHKIQLVELEKIKKSIK